MVFTIKNKHHSTFRLLPSSRSYRITFKKKFLFTFYTKSFTIKLMHLFHYIEEINTIHLTTQVNNIIDHFTKYLPSIIFIISIRTLIFILMQYPNTQYPNTSSYNYSMGYIYINKLIRIVGGLIKTIFLIERQITIFM